MNSSRFAFVIAALALTLSVFISVPGEAAAAKKPTVPPPDMRKMIKAIDVAANAVVVEYMNSRLLHTYRIDDFTLIKINNVPGKFADIKPGMEVADYTERDNDDLDGITLIGSGEEPAAAPTAKPKPQPKPKPAPTT